jgi:hypothetical protein
VRLPKDVKRSFCRPLGEPRSPADIANRRELYQYIRNFRDMSEYIDGIKRDYGSAHELLKNTDLKASLQRINDSFQKHMTNVQESVEQD